MDVIITKQRRLVLSLIVVVLLAINLFLLLSVNTLRWPFLWPRPAIFILIGGVVLALWFREFLTGIWALRIVGLCMIFIGESYFLHSLQVMLQHFSVVAVIHFVGFACTFFVMALNYVNQVWPKNNEQPPSLPPQLPDVAVIIPTYGEPYPILERTLVSLLQLDYPAEKLCIVISDDGHRDEIRQMVQLYHVHYNEGPRKDAKAGNLNAALQYLEKVYPQAELILTQDADEMIDSSFLKKTIGYFSDPQLAFVQTPKEAFTPAGDPFGNRDRVFYDTLQPGRNGSGAAFSCGSGVLWRLSAIQAIGGFSTWNIVEDLTTSYLLHSKGYRSDYHNEILSVGLSPDDIPGLLKQRGTWATDTWRLFLFDNPLRKPNLSWRQRLQYLELGLFYGASVFFLPPLMLTPVLSLASGDLLPIEGSALFPWLAISFVYYAVLSRGRVKHLTRMWQYWVGHWPTYTKAFWVALRSRDQKPTYQVTRKTRQDGFYGHLLWPQFLYIAISLVLMIRALFWMNDVNLANRLTNVSILIFFAFMMSAICVAAFYGVDFGAGIRRKYYAVASGILMAISLTHDVIINLLIGRSKGN